MINASIFLAKKLVCIMFSHHVVKPMRQQGFERIFITIVLNVGIHKQDGLHELKHAKDLGRKTTHIHLRASTSPNPVSKAS